ncbi:MAG: hypothetical protein WEA82_06695 [Idiomarina sp.]
MHKDHKKIDREIIRALTGVCEHAKIEVDGFKWLTHEVNYQRFPQSLRVLLVFSDKVHEDQVLAGLQALVPAVQQALQPITNTKLPAEHIEARQERRLH